MSFIESIKQDGIISEQNSTSVHLHANESFTGSYVDCLNYGAVAVVVKTFGDNADGIIYFHNSVDGTDPAEGIGQSEVSASNGGLSFHFSPRGRYFKVSYVNGANNQTDFVLQTALYSGIKGFTFNPLLYTLSDTSTALTTKAVISGKNATSGLYRNVALDDGNNLAVTAIQHVAASTLNSFTTSSLAPLTTWSGSSESTLGVAGIQVMLYASQNCTLNVRQSGDGTNWDVVDEFEYKSLIESSFSRTIQAVGSYFKVDLKNDSAVDAATNVRLFTALCPVVEAIPRSISEEGNLKVGVYEIEDAYDNPVKISPIGALNTTKATRITGTSFAGTVIDPNFWTSTSGSGATNVQTGGQFELRTNTTANASGSLQSFRNARYMVGSANYFRGIVDVGTTPANNSKRWGVWTTTGTAMNDPLDGAIFEIINGIFSVVLYKAGNIISQAHSGELNGEYGQTLIIPSGAASFEIVFTSTKVRFMISGKSVHIFSATDQTWTDMMTLPIRLENVNTGNSVTDTSLKARSLSINRFGDAESAPHWKYIHGAVTASVLKYNAGRLQKVVVNAWTAGSEVRVYDALSATNPIALIVPTSTNDAQQSFAIPYNLDFYTGLTVTTINAATDVTIVYE